MPFSGNAGCCPVMLYNAIMPSAWCELTCAKIPSNEHLLDERRAVLGNQICPDPALSKQLNPEWKPPMPTQSSTELSASSSPHSVCKCCMFSGETTTSTLKFEVCQQMPTATGPNRTGHARGMHKDRCGVGSTARVTSRFRRAHMAVVQPDAGVVGHQGRGPHDRRNELEAVHVAAVLGQRVPVKVSRVHVYLVALSTQGLLAFRI